MKKLLYSLLAILFIVLIACNKQTDSGNNNNSPATSFPVEFTYLPLDTANFTNIMPLGNLNPLAGHISPSDHIYFVLHFNGNTSPQVPVYAVGSGTISDIQGGYTDGGVYIAFNNNQKYYYGHINLNANLKVGDVVKAGDKIGVSSGLAQAVDLGYFNTAGTILPRLVKSTRYPSTTGYCIDPLTLYSSAWQSFLYAKEGIVNNQKGGKIDFDLPGTLKGNWFDSTASASNTGVPAFWNLCLSFLGNSSDTSQLRISIGGTTGSTSNNLSLPGCFSVKNNTPTFESVNRSSGLTKYVLYNQYDLSFSNPLGLLLVQVIDDQKIKVETTTDLNAIAFSAAARNYIR